jgi:hypothetical protein
LPRIRENVEKCVLLVVFNLVAPPFAVQIFESQQNAVFG